jgi:hypothetical protein
LDFLRNESFGFDEEKLDEIPKMLWDASAQVRKAAARHMYELAFSHEDDGT